MIDLTHAITNIRNFVYTRESEFSKEAIPIICNILMFTI